MNTAMKIARVSAWRHARAVLLLPVMNTVVIPAALLRLVPSPPSHWSTATVATAIAGTAIAGAGAALVAHSVRLFVRFGNGTLAPWDPTRELVAAGAYRHTRNPMKLGLFLVLGGEAMLIQSTPIAVWFACFAIANILYIRLHEEPRLEARFGARYRDYCERVPRWWPKLRSSDAIEGQANDDYA